MKIHSTKPHGAQQRISSIFRFAAICSAVLLSSAACAQLSAQTGLFGARGATESSPTLGQQITHGNELFRVVQASAFPTAAAPDVTNAAHVADVANRTPTIAQVGHCQSCGTGCGGTCGGCYGSCGGSGRNFGGACGNRIQSGLGNACAPCVPYYYVLGETLYMDRERDENFSLSPNYTMGGFSSEYGGRITIGMVPDCVHGYEFSFVGKFEWDMAGGILDPGGGIQTFLRPEVPLTATDLSAFNDTVTGSAQAYEAEYWGLELNRILVGWDFAKLVYGARYIDYDERFTYLSTNNAAESGFFGSGTSNQMVGLQLGMDLLYPISRNGYTDFRTRLGGMLNYSESRVTLINAGTTLINAGDDTTDIAGVFEIGGGLRYQVGEMLSIRGGAELWYITGVATANRQFGPFVSPAFTGRSTRRNHSVLMTGVSVGAELRF